MPGILHFFKTILPLSSSCYHAERIETEPDNTIQQKPLVVMEHDVNLNFYLYLNKPMNIRLSSQQTPHCDT